MRYGEPSMASRIAALQAQGCDRLLVVPLYPQYCAATSATVADRAFDALKACAGTGAAHRRAILRPSGLYRGVGGVPARRAGEARVRAGTDLVSWHGIPQDYFDKGDPYYCHCAKTTRLLSEAPGSAIKCG